MTMHVKFRTDGPPIVFFGVVVAAKIYSLWIYMSGNQDAWAMLRNIGSIDLYGHGAAFFLTDKLSSLLYFVTAVAFDALVLYSFIVRGEAKKRPEGVWENLFPLITVFVPVIGFTLLFVPQVRQHVPGYSVETLGMLRDITPMYGFYAKMLGLTIGFVGAALSIWSISYLKRSFGLRTAVRTLVTRGPYARIRHPLYVGELLHIFGIAILSAKPIGLYLFVFAVVLQVVRARIEERKFLRALPEYETYMAHTGFLWPRLNRPRQSG